MLAENLSDIFQRGLEFGYDYENQLIKALPKLAELVSSPELKASFEKQVIVSKRHAAALERIFAGLNRATASQPNKSISSILGESEKLVRHIEKSPLLDASLTITANLLAYNGVGLYGSLSGLAGTLNLEEAVRPVGEILADEKAWVSELEQIAAQVNPQALGVVNSLRGFAII
jgi:ferritin-like metal-binding protein YciE